MQLLEGSDGLQKVLDGMAKPREATRARSAVAADSTAPSAATASHNDSHEQEVPPEFRPIDQGAFRAEVVAWKRLKDRTPPAEASPPPPLNPSQRVFAREHLAVQRFLASGRRRGEDPNTTLDDLRRQGLRQVHLLQGAGGVGKSVLLAAMDRVLTRLGLGAMAVTAWTGVASAPFGSTTLCDLLKINFCTIIINIRVIQ